MLTKVENAAEKGTNGAGKWVPRAAMTDTFTTNTVLLLAEGEHGKGCNFKIRDRGSSGGKAARTNSEHHIAETKWCSLGVLGGCAGIFTRSVEKEKGNVGHIRNSKIKG
jgi:hypothetical protein